MTDIVKKHYQEEAKKWGDSPNSTMDDEIIRRKETEIVLDFVNTYVKSGDKVADIGCGNGHTLSLLTIDHTDCQFWGIDVTKEILEIAETRKKHNLLFAEQDVTAMDFRAGHFNAIYTQRCLINLLTWDEQKKALNEIYRVLHHGGHFLMVECFTDGFENLNRARVECGLEPIEPASFNNYLDKDIFLNEIHGKFAIIDHSNFLSSHYFVARVIHPLVTKGEQKKNTEFVKFLSGVMPVKGNYSPLQAFTLKKPWSVAD